MADRDEKEDLNSVSDFGKDEGNQLVQQYRMPTFRSDSASEIGLIYLNQWLDCEDFLGVWHEAQIYHIELCVDNDDDSEPGAMPIAHWIKVRYKGLDSKFDEWFNLYQPKQRQRLCHLHSHTLIPTNGNIRLLKQGSKYHDKDLKLTVDNRIYCMDELERWRNAIICEVNKFSVLVEYLEGEKSYKEWIDRFSYRLAPLNHYSKPEIEKKNPFRFSDESESLLSAAMVSYKPEIPSAPPPSQSAVDSVASIINPASDLSVIIPDSPSLRNLLAHIGSEDGISPNEEDQNMIISPARLSEEVMPFAFDGDFVDYNRPVGEADEEDVEMKEEKSDDRLQKVEMKIGKKDEEKGYDGDEEEEDEVALQDHIPMPVRSIMSMGFDEGAVMAAYIVYSEAGVTDDCMIDQLLTHLRESALMFSDPGDYAHPVFDDDESEL